MNIRPIQQHPLPTRRAAASTLPAFTLIEIVICMALFAISFAAIAAMLPAGMLMERDLRNSADAAICGRNSLEVMKGQGLQTLGMETIAHTYVPGSGLMNINMATQKRMPNFPGTYPADAVDMETRCHSSNFVNAGGDNQPGICYYADMSQAEATQNGGSTLSRLFDTNGDRKVWGLWHGGASCDYFARLSFSYLTDPNDGTNWSMGRIHVFKNRHIAPYNPLDCSYPSSVLDLAARTHFTHVMLANRSSTPCAVDRRFCDPTANDWRLVAVTTSATSGGTGEWPEQYEADLGSPGLQGTSWSQTPTFLHSNTFAYMRSRSGSGSTGCGTNGWTEDWIRGMCNYSYMNNYQAVGGGAPVGWDWLGINNSVASTVADSDGKYKIPTPLFIHAIVYDRSKDLLLLRYPQCFAKVPQAGNARVNTFRATYGITPSTWVDRKLRVGDSLLTTQYGLPLKVKDVLDPVAEGATLPASSYGPQDWSDGTYQIVRVTPSLTTLPFTANQSAKLNSSSNDMGTQSNTEWTSPYLSGVVVAPPPITGGASPWAATVQLPCGNNQSAQTNTTQNPFRNRANTAE